MALKHSPALGRCAALAGHAPIPQRMDLLKPLITLLAIVNPIGAAPFFLAC